MPLLRAAEMRCRKNFNLLIDQRLDIVLDGPLSFLIIQNSLKFLSQCILIYIFCFLGLLPGEYDLCSFTYEQQNRLILFKQSYIHERLLNK